MASAQLMEEELQHSVKAAEHDEADMMDYDPIADEADDDADGEVDDSLMAQNFDSVMVNGTRNLGNTADTLESDQDEDAEDEEEEEGEDDGDEEDEDEHAESEDDNDDEDEDEEEYVQDATRPQVEGLDEDDVDEGVDEDEDDGEGVGAVKIRPGETDDEDGSEESDASDAQSDSPQESDGEASWGDAAEHQEEEVEDEEEEDDNIDLSHACMFCKDGDEKEDQYLICRGCGENSHEQCARNNSALNGDDVTTKWKCPECASVDLAVEEENDASGSTAPLESPSTRSAAAQKIASRPESSSTANNQGLGEDSADGSRVLRKRKTSSVEPDEHVMSLRKRRRNTGDALSHDEAEAGAEDSSKTQSSRPLRPLRPKASDSAITVDKKTRTSRIVKLKVNAAELRRILGQPPNPKARRGRAGRPGGRGGARGRPPLSAAPPPPPVLTAPFASASSTLYQPFFFDKESEELKGKPYGGILNEADADTSKTFPQPEDRKRFDEAKQKAEEEWRQRILKMQQTAQVAVKKAKKSAGPASQIECIEFGGWEIDTWYAAPYPEEYSRNRVLYICEFCLKYMNSDYVAWRHKLKCPAKHPPGDEIYRHGSVSMFEVDGRKNPVYCQNLCLLAKLFLGSKTLYYDVEPFLFYVLCEFDDYGYHFVGYFSKEKRASSQNNVSCILTLPIHQRKGYGNLLIDFSYLLTRVEKKTGSPEKPLSDMGLVSYRNYWRLVLCQYLVDHVSGDKAQKTGLSIKKMSDDTGLTPDDVIAALEGLRCLVRDPQTETYAFRVDLAFCKEYVQKWEAKKYVKLDPKYLTWTPYVMGRGNATNFELGPALNAIAPREDDEDDMKPIDPEIALLTNGEQAVVSEGHPAMHTEPAVLQSTEPTDVAPTIMVTPEDKPTNEVVGETIADKDGSSANGVEGALEPSEPSEPKWMSPYKDIPVMRFQVFPPLSRRMDRPRTTVVRMPIAQPITMPRPPKPPKRPAGGRRATASSSASKPKSSSTRVRKTGGTGRGPGRWPKGTKKSDYGNADSGPGLPPAWIAARRAEEAAKKEAAAGSSASGAPVELPKGETVTETTAAAPDMDTVQVQTPAVEA